MAKVHGKMSMKSGFSISDHDRLCGDPPMTSPFFRRQAYELDDAGNYPAMDEPLRRTPHVYWQALSPDSRSDTLRRAHLISLLRQVNPNLHVCRRPTVQMTTSTAEKGIQVPDVRYELPILRKPPLKKEQKVSIVAPGVRIQRRDMDDCNGEVVNGDVSEGTHNFASHQGADLFGTQRSVLAAKSSGLQVTLKTGSADRKVTNSVLQNNHCVGENNHAGKSDARQEEDVPIINIDKRNEELNNNENQANKSKDGSSGDDDSVVVVLDEPPSEQGLERKYGQFFCRRCFRGWSSRSVWCLRNTCKVYIKQTCNSCNKLVNPYLVCRLPGFSNTIKDTK